jgi:hypothetical protein
MYRHDMGTTSIEGSNDPYDCFTSVEYVKGFDTEEDAQAMADKITTAVENGRELDARYWVYERCSYGSEAYQKNGRGDREMLEWERQHEDY